MGKINCYLDSNICISFIQGDHAFHNKSLNIVEKLVSSAAGIFISPLVLDETIYQLFKLAKKSQIKNVFKKIKPEISNFLKLPFLTICNPPIDPKSQLRVIHFINKFKLKPRDAYHLLIMKHHKIKYFATFDSDFDPVFSSRYLNHFPPLLAQ